MIDTNSESLLLDIESGADLIESDIYGLSSMTKDCESTTTTIVPGSNGKHNNLVNIMNSTFELVDDSDLDIVKYNRRSDFAVTDEPAVRLS